MISFLISVALARVLKLSVHFVNALVIFSTGSPIEAPSIVFLFIAIKPIWNTLMIALHTVAAAVAAVLSIIIAALTIAIGSSPVPHCAWLQICNKGCLGI